MKQLGLYIHIPFCVKKCRYCDFLSAPYSEAKREQYVRALTEEIAKAAPKFSEYTVDTVFIGGGAVLLKQFLERSDRLGKYLFIEELKANARGYDLLYRAYENGK